jgi:hypothetical protein
MKVLIAIVFFVKIFVLFGRFGVPIIFFMILGIACKFRQIDLMRVFGSLSLLNILFLVALRNSYAKLKITRHMFFDVCLLRNQYKILIVPKK